MYKYVCIDICIYTYLYIYIIYTYLEIQLNLLFFFSKAVTLHPPRKLLQANKKAAIDFDE